MKVSNIVLAVAVVAITALSVKGASKESGNDSAVLTADNTIVLNSEVDGASVAEVISKAKQLDSNLSGFKGIKELGKAKRPLYLVLNTPGGSIQDGLELIEALNGLGRPVHTVTMFAASMGFQIAQSLGDRLILRNGVLMSHRAAGSFTGSFGGEAPSQIDNRYHMWTQRMQELDQQTVRRSNGKQTLQSYQKQYANEMWVTGQESVAQGYADKIVSVRCDSTLSGTSHHEAMILGMIAVSYEISDCPLITAPLNVRVKVETSNGPMNEDEFIKAGGQFGAVCLLTNSPKKLCALDTTLSRERLTQIKTEFQQTYAGKTRNRPSFDFYGARVTW